MIMVKIDNTTTIMLVDSGAQSTVLGKKQFDNLVRGGLRPEERLRVYGNGYLTFVGQFEASISVVEGNFGIYPCDKRRRCLLGSSAAKRLQMLRFGPELGVWKKCFL